MMEEKDTPVTVVAASSPSPSPASSPSSPSSLPSSTTLSCPCPTAPTPPRPSMPSPAGSSTPLQIIHFEKDDPGNPYNWHWARKFAASATIALMAINSTVSSSISSNVNDQILAEFHVGPTIEAYLPLSMFQVGYTFGPLLFGPLSESYGRKPVLFYGFNAFALFTLASALAPNWPVLLVFRLCAGAVAAVPLNINGGLFADLYLSAQMRGRAMVLFMSTTTFAPLLGPIVSGWAAPLGWRWTFWIALILAGASWLPVALLPETYGPVLLKRRAARLRRETGRTDLVAPIELETDGSIGDFVTRSLSRPLRMLFCEPLVYLNCTYIMFMYTFFYMFFEAYPIIFRGVYHFSIGQASLALLPIAIGAMSTAPVLIAYDDRFERDRRRGRAWAQREELHRLPIACLGGPFVVTSFFWLAWTARAGVPWIVPCLSGLFFGFAYLLIFTACINYQCDAYEIYAASAMAASCFSRSIVGAVLPLAVAPLYGRLGVAWATSLMGFLSIGLLLIPFALIHWGPRIRARSTMCQELMLLAEQRKRDNHEVETSDAEEGEGGAEAGRLPAAA